MDFLKCLLLLALCSVCLATKVGEWTLTEFSRYCDDDGRFCAYHFSISEINLNGADPGPGSACYFPVLGVNGQPANETNFQDLGCQPGPAWYRVNGGWNSNGYLIVVVTNTLENAYAFFGYNDLDLLEGASVQSQTQTAYEIGTFDGSSVASPQA